ncbi:MAG: hypothetical protein UR26_C0001G0126 [candidate division TM6 bacterium GW2011_GWF2_32_72]|nr:MAG: hypothetical protein UR26_C0001G0126 [candidate division TM6 bacterium GW2011_GWF2_32_72]
MKNKTRILIFSTLALISTIILWEPDFIPAPSTLNTLKNKIYTCSEITKIKLGLKRSYNYPYITYQSFMYYCDHIFPRNLKPANVKAGDTIYIGDENLLQHFFEEIHPKISVPYILITHDAMYTGQKKYFKYLNDSKIIAWFTKNPIDQHEKIFGLPVGLPPKGYKHGNTKLLKSMMGKKLLKKHTLYLNIIPGPCLDERMKVFNMFRYKNYCYNAYPIPHPENLKNEDRKNYLEYIMDIKESKFVLSPRGLGLDTHRMWETIMLGSYPIVKTSCLDFMIQDLPVIIVQNWDEVTEEFLEKKYIELQNNKYNFEKLYIDYWLNQIEAIKKGIIQRATI